MSVFHRKEDDIDKMDDFLSLQISVSQLVFIPDPVPGTSSKQPAAARMCSDFNTDQCGEKQVDVPPESQRGGVTTVQPVVAPTTVVPNQVSCQPQSLT